MSRVFALTAFLLAVGCTPVGAAQIHGGYVLTCTNSAHELAVTRITPGRVVAICEAPR